MNLRRRTHLALLVLVLLTAGVQGVPTPPYVWIEGERPVGASFPWNAQGVERSELLSEGRWLVARERVNLPVEGYLIEYEAKVEEPGRYAVWLRVGFEWVRANLAWRFDGGRWTRVGIAAPLTDAEKKKIAGRPEPDLERRTTNVKEVGLWNEVSWWNVGDIELGRGPHRLELRFTRTHLDNPLVAVDAIALVRGVWTPEGKLRPGEVYDGELDRRAADHVFRLPEPASTSARTEVTLDGPWQVARYDDPDMNTDTLEPVRRLPTVSEYDLKWMGIEVPRDASTVAELSFGHRLIFRTKVHVPEQHRGRGFTLHFSGTNWIVGVFVGGEFVGDHTGVWIPWDLDISDHILPGRDNEISLAIKGSYYAYDPGWAAGDIESKRNLPRSRHRWTRWIAPIYPSTKGDGDGLAYGIVNSVRLSAVGRVYTEGVFIKPSVRRKKLSSDVTVRNTTDRAQKVAVICEAVSDRDDRVEKTFGPEELTLPPRSSTQVTVAGSWPDPRLWWPRENPDLYRLRTRILVAGDVVDIQEELFGFREVTVEGPAILINGVRRNFWNWVDVPGRIGRAEDYERAWREGGNRFMRFSHGRKITAALRSREERLEFYDRRGMPGRLCSMIDGMFINYNLLERNGDRVQPNSLVWESFRRHIDQLTRTYRNHPSIIMYQIENELVYINGMNTTGRSLPIVERAMLEVYRVGKANDPTRPYTVGGGGDLSRAEGVRSPEEALEINCPHYPRGRFDWYPENAYRLEQYSTKIARWPWTRKKPWVVGESCYASSLEMGSYVAGPIAFRSQDEANRSKARFLRMLYGGYRWAGVAGFFPWDILSQYEDGRKIFSDLCVIPGRQTHRLYGGRRNELTFKTMNDTLSRAPVTFEWSYQISGRKIAGARRQLDIEPGHGVLETLVITPPVVSERTEGSLTLRATQNGTEDFVDVRAIPVLPYLRRIKIAAESPVTLPVFLMDRSGRIAPFLEETGVRFRRMESLSEAEDPRGLLIVGPDALTIGEARGRELLVFAARGGRILVLEQEHPVAGGNLPVPLQTTNRFGGYAHAQALGTPLFRDLGRDDLIDWAGGHPTYRNVYVKPKRGGRSLVECGALLPYSALVEIAAGKGLLALCQLRIGANLRLDPAADILFRNMLERYASYRPPTAIAAVYSPGNKLLARKVEETGVLVESTPTIEAALDIETYRVAIIDARKENLDRLVAMKAKTDAFQHAGGWIMLSNVRPESLDRFNELTGTSHLLRPFRIERVHLLDTDTPLAATLGDGDVMLYGTEWIARWAGKRWASGNTFTYTIDGDDAAPFTYPPGAEREPYVYRPTRDDKDPYNFVNGLVGADFWKYIQQIWIPEEGPTPMVFTLRRPETIREIRIWNNTNYGTIKDLEIVFDDDTGHALEMTLPDSGEMVSLKLPEPRAAERAITLKIRTWRAKPETNKQPRLVGIDNVQFLRAQRPSRGVFLDSAGALVAFEKGKGGVFLNQIKFMAEEPLGENDAKKVELLGTILQNMGLGTRTAIVAVPGLNVEYETVDFTDRCNRFMTEMSGRAGWFGRKGEDLSRLPRGRHYLAGVLYHVVDFATSPVPDCILLGGLRGSPGGLDREIKGLRVGRKADVLFFLHTARVTRPLSERDRERLEDSKRPGKLPEVARYVLNYADGQNSVVPVLLEKHIDHWLTEKPETLEGAAIAWSARLAPGKKTFAVVYSMEVLNPRPDVEIETVDFLPGLDDQGRTSRRAVPVLIALTVGSIEK